MATARCKARWDAADRHDCVWRDSGIVDGTAHRHDAALIPDLHRFRVGPARAINGAIDPAGITGYQCKPCPYPHITLIPTNPLTRKGGMYDRAAPR